MVYPLPWWGLQTSATFQSLPGPEITASYTASNAQIARRSAATWRRAGPPPGLQRHRDRAAASRPAPMFGDRLNQVDFRLSKTFTLPGSRRVQALVDLYNLFNANPVLAQNNTFGPQWQRPTQILQGRW